MASFQVLRGRRKSAGSTETCDMLDLIGHAEVLALLGRAIAANRLSHAYLITGPRGTGRRTLALELAQAMNCLAESPAQRPCHQCRQCRLIQRGVHPDVRLVRRAPARPRITLHPGPDPIAKDGAADNIEFIQSDAQLRPVDGRTKVYIILNAEELAADAANRLLKTIEEPTAYVRFLLTASDRGAVMPTIVSRCQEIRLRSVPRQELEQALVDRGLAEPERAAGVAALASGRPGAALTALHDPAVAEVRRADVRDLRDALAANRVERLILARGLAERWSSQPETVRGTLRAWLDWWRDVLLVQLGMEGSAALREQADLVAARAVATKLSPTEVRTVQERVRQTLQDLDANVNARLALDLLLLKLPSTA